MTIDFKVVTGLTTLRKSHGYWSGADVYFNPTSNIVLLNESLTIDSIQMLVKDYYNTSVQEDINRFIEKQCAANDRDVLTYLRSGLLKKYFRVGATFDGWLRQYDVHGSTFPRTMKSIAHLLERKYASNAIIRGELASIIAEAVRSDSHCINLYPRASSMLVLGHPWVDRTFHRWTADKHSIQDVLRTIAAAAWGIRWSKKTSIHKDEAKKQIIKVLELLNDPELPPADFALTPFTSTLMHNISGACRLVLGRLVEKQYVLLPPSLELAGAIWNDVRCLQFLHSSIDDASHKSFIYRLLASSTLITPRDVPANIRECVYDSIPDSPLLNSTLLPMLRDYAKNNELKPFPLEQLHGLKARGRSKALKWSAQWLREQRAPEPWIRYAEFLEKASQASQSHHASMIRSFVEWGWFQRRFQTPSDIILTDLYNPHKPKQSDTLYHYINSDKNINDKCAVWVNASQGFRLAYNLALLTGDASFLPNNPFQNIDNPFPGTSNYKTHRKRLPENLHEAMIEVLMSPDKSGMPTYDFVKNVLRWDWYSRKDPDTNCYESVWCPSRAACLAALFLLPIRAKQARWSDEGLLDTKIWDLDQDTYVDNRHPLGNWIYPNGGTHSEMYRRNSGVLQPLADPFMNHRQLGIFISTNKTQMWDPAKKAGHELYWPRGDELRDSVDPVVKAQSDWLRRPYDVIFEQRRWLATYDPNPVPVTFLDSSEDFRGVNKELASEYPYFTPLFRDMTQPYFRRDGTEFYLPATHSKLSRLLNAVAVETESRLRAQGVKVTLTAKSESATSYEGKSAIVDIHSLRVAGISRMIEMGVPVHIIQEYIVAHATEVMTLHYGKHEADYIRKTLLNATRKMGYWLNWDAKVADIINKQPPVIVTNPRYPDVTPETIVAKDTFIGWKGVDGGLCGTGGTGCDIGGIVINEQAANGRQKTVWGPVVGGCGNCRFFCTGPAFILQQAQVMNEIMLQMRTVGKQRKELLDKLGDVTWRDNNVVDKSTISNELHRLKEQVSELDRRLEPLILEWYNRYGMLEESKALLAREKEFPQNEIAAGGTPLMLVSASTVDELSKEIEIRAERAGDFALVRQILETAWIRGGLEKASELPKALMREFMDRILMHENAAHLLISISDERERNHISLMLAEALSQLVGDNAIQQALDDSKALGLEDPNMRKKVTDMIGAIMSGTQKLTNRADADLHSAEPEQLLIMGPIQ